MLSFQNPHHLSGPVAGPMILPKGGLTAPTVRSRQPNAYPGFEKDSRGGFKPSTSKEENAGSDVMVQAGQNGGQISRSHSSDSISGSGSDDNRKQQRRSRKRRMEDEEQEQERQEEDEEEEEADSPYASRYLDRLAEKEEDAEEEEEEEQQEEGEDVGDGEVQRKILTQKPLGLLAHHGLSSARSTSGSIRFHRNRDPDDDVIADGGGNGERQRRRQSNGDGRDVRDIYDIRYDDDDDGDDVGVEAEDGRPESGGGEGSGAAGGQRRGVSPPYLSLTENDVVGGRRRPPDYGSTAMSSLMDRRFMPSPPPSPSASPGSGQCPSTPGGGHHWTFEEQFKQLYELTDDPNRKLFLDDLFSFMQKRGTPVNRIPIMAKQTLDLFELFQLVVSKGGLVEVINKKLWREITKGLSLPSSITSAAFTLRTQYMKYLYPYECEKLKLSTLSELQYAVDGNRREGRRSGFGQEFSPLTPILPLTPATVSHIHDGLQGINPTARPQVPMLMKDRDHHVMLTPTLNQLRTLAECEAQTAKAAANQAMVEATKRMHEEATRAAVLNAGPGGPGQQQQLTIQGSAAAAGLCGGGGGGTSSRLPPGPAGLSSSSTGANPMPKTGEAPVKRPGGLDHDERRFHSSLPHHRTSGGAPGISTAHIRLTGQGNGHSNHLGNSIIGSMEINGVLYQGVLFAQPPTANGIE